ncbi:MAG: DUF1566 domain-containing protein [Chitinophagaceae bacterium]|nr:DUF1566 domain-containing protein [Chitinophagaceae bacterium]
MAGCSTPGIAARICGDLVLNGYSDWYLPSKEELDKLYINRAAIGGFVSNSVTVYYWSSSEYNDGLAWTQRFFDDLRAQDGKHTPDRVRAIRAF